MCDTKKRNGEYTICIILNVQESGGKGSISLLFHCYISNSIQTTLTWSIAKIMTSTVTTSKQAATASTVIVVNGEANCENQPPPPAAVGMLLDCN